MPKSIFYLANAFSSNLKTINMEVFANLGGIYMFVRKFNKRFRE